MYAETIFQFKKTLNSLDDCMIKAAAYADTKKFDVNILAQARLAPDMFAFNRQIQSACDAAKFATAYLTNQTAPKHEDTETTWTELRERIKKVQTYMETFKKGDFENPPAQIKPGWAKGQWLTPEDYVQQVAIPNFYFHVMAAYAIMRHSGADIGKMDYLGKVNMQGQQQA